MYIVIDRDDNDGIAYRDTREACEKWATEHQDLHSSDEGPRFAVEEEVEPPKPNNNAKLIQSLREMADWLDARPEFPFVVIGAADAFVDTAEELARHGRTMGRAKKGSVGGYVELRRDFGIGLAVRLNAEHAKVCRKVEKQVTMPAEPEQVIPAKPERVETVVEWECPDSILALAAP